MSGKKKETAQKRKLALEKVEEELAKVKEDGLTLKKVRELYTEVEAREMSLENDRQIISDTIAELARHKIIIIIDGLLLDALQAKVGRPDPGYDQRQVIILEGDPGSGKTR